MPFVQAHNQRSVSGSRQASHRLGYRRLKISPDSLRFQAFLGAPFQFICIVEELGLRHDVPEVNLDSFLRDKQQTLNKCNGGKTPFFSPIYDP